MNEPISGWVNDANCYGVRVGTRWIPWAIGARPRPWIGEYAEVVVDDEGYARNAEVIAWRPAPPTLN